MRWEPPDYEVCVKGEISGPFKLAELGYRLRQGKLQLEDSYRRKGASEWQTLRQREIRSRRGEALFWGVYAAGLIAVGLWFLPKSLAVVEMARKAVDWPSTQGRITYAQVENPQGKSYTFQPKIIFAYRVAGRNYLGTNIYPGLLIGRESWARTVVARYPAGGTVPVFFKRNAPGFSLLEPGVRPHTWVFTGMVAAMIYAGILLGIAAIRVSRRDLVQKPSLFGAFLGLGAFVSVIVGGVLIFWLP